MKLAHTFSLDAEQMREYFLKCEELNLNKNAVLDVLIKEWLADREITIINCPVCGAKYSSKINTCPQCEQSRLIKQEEEKATKQQEETALKKSEVLTELNMKLKALEERKTYLETHITKGHAQQSEIDAVVGQIKNIEQTIKDTERE